MAHYMQDFTERMRIIKGRLVRLWPDAPQSAGTRIRRGQLCSSGPGNALVHSSLSPRKRIDVQLAADRRHEMSTVSRGRASPVR